MKVTCLLKHVLLSPNSLDAKVLFLQEKAEALWKDNMCWYCMPTESLIDAELQQLLEISQFVSFGWERGRDGSHYQVGGVFWQTSPSLWSSLIHKNYPRICSCTVTWKGQRLWWTDQNKYNPHSTTEQHRTASAAPVHSSQMGALPSHQSMGLALSSR